MKLFPYLTAALLLASLPVACAGSCGDKSGGASSAPGASASAPASASAAAPSSSSSADRSDGDDMVRPVYPITNDPPDPLAQRLCQALHTVPAERKAACCKTTPPFTIINECTRTLSFALREKSVTLDPADVDKCADAINKSTEGCEWVNPLSLRAPPECDGIIKGTVPEGSRCRASLECVDGLRCLGSGPTDPGSCRKPLGRGGPCSHAVDTLAAYTGQLSSEARHPECAGFCARRWCADVVPVGGACEVHEACGPGRSCIDNKCAEGPLPPAGQPCRGGQCASGARCVKGQCAPLGAAGEPCERNTDCRSGCQKAPGAKTGKCAMKCWATPDDATRPSK